MASWKKVLVSGSSIEIASVTSSATPTISSIGSNYVMMIDPTTGYLTKITSGNFQASLGQYAYTASAVSGTPIIIGAADTLNISGSSGLTTTISSISGGARINVNANAGSGIGIVNNTITVDTGSTHFIAGVDNEVFKSANFVDSSNIDFTVTAGTSVTAGIITGSVVNAHLQNSAVTITAGSGLTGGGSTSLGASSTLNVGAGTGITVNADDIQLKNAGSLTGNVLPRWDSGNGQLINSGLTDDGTSLGITRNTGVTGWLNVTGAITGSAISSSGTLSGLTISSGNTITAGTNVLVPSGYLTVGSPGGAPNTVGAVQGVIGFFSSNVTVAGDLNVTTNANITGNTTITGNLTVNGTTTTINTDNLLVEDRFALFASGSTTATDGGIVVQAATGAGTATGFALGYNATADRWAYQDALAFNATSFGTPTAYAVTAETAAGAPAANPAYGGATYGYGNVYVNSSNGDIFIYS